MDLVRDRTPVIVVRVARPRTEDLLSALAAGRTTGPALGPRRPVAETLLGAHDLLAVVVCRERVADGSPKSGAGVRRNAESSVFAGGGDGWVLAKPLFAGEGAVRSRVDLTVGTAGVGIGRRGKVMIRVYSMVVMHMVPVVVC